MSKEITGAVIVIILGIIAVSIVASVVNNGTTIPTNTQTLTLVNNTEVLLAQDDLDSLTSLNISGAILNESEQYTLNKARGGITLIDNNYNGTATAAYSYFDSATIRSALDRTIVGFIVTMAAVAVLIMATNVGS